MESIQQVIAGTLIGDCVSFLDEVIGLFSICTIFDFDLDAFANPGVKELACKLHLLPGLFVFHVLKLPLAIVGRCHGLDFIYFVVFFSRRSGELGLSRHGSGTATCLDFYGFSKVVLLLGLWRNDLLASEIFEDIIRFGRPLKFTLPTNKVGFSFELSVVLDLVHLGVSHVWGLCPGLYPGLGLGL